MFRRFVALWIMAIAISLTTSCSVRKPMGEVSGTVTYQRKPLTEGSVSFYLAERGFGASAPLDGAGRYSFAAPLDLGSYVVSFAPPSREPPGPGRPAPRVVTNLPARYLEPISSGLKAEVKDGKNQIDFDLVE